MNKRDIVLGLLDAKQPLPYTPAAFFLHFSPEFHAGQAAVDKHLEYFRHTGMDFIKIQYEVGFPRTPDIHTPDDWAKIPKYGRDFFAGQLQAVEGLIKAAKSEAVIIAPSCIRPRARTRVASVHLHCPQFSSATAQ